MASSLDEHGGAVEGHEECSVLGLTSWPFDVKTARGGESLLRACRIDKLRGRDSMPKYTGNSNEPQARAGNDFHAIGRIVRPRAKSCRESRELRFR
jgi:hypothetical protein